MRWSKVTRAVCIANTDDNHFRANIISIHAAELVHQTDNGIKMSVTVQQIQNRIVDGVTTPHRNMHPYLPFFAQDFRINVNFFTGRQVFRRPIFVFARESESSYDYDE